MNPHFLKCYFWKSLFFTWYLEKDPCVWSVISFKIINLGKASLKKIPKVWLVTIRGSPKHTWIFFRKLLNVYSGSFVLLYICSGTYYNLPFSQPDQLKCFWPFGSIWGFNENQIFWTIWTPLCGDLSCVGLMFWRKKTKIPPFVIVVLKWKAHQHTKMFRLRPNHVFTEPSL